VKWRNTDYSSNGISSRNSVKVTSRHLNRRCGNDISLSISLHSRCYNSNKKDAPFVASASKRAETEVNFYTKQCIMWQNIKPQLWFQNWTAIKTPKIPFLAMTEKKYAYACSKIKVLLTRFYINYISNTVDKFIIEVSWNMHVLHKDQNTNHHLNVLLIWQLCDAMNHKWLQKRVSGKWEIHNQRALCPLSPALAKILW
jgi:hypothetical protein